MSEFFLRQVTKIKNEVRYLTNKLFLEQICAFQTIQIFFNVKLGTTNQTQGGKNALE